MLTPLSPDQWDRAKAAHLLNRAGFGGPPEEIDALAKNGMAFAIARIVDGPAAPVPAVAPDWAQPRDLTSIRARVRDAVMSVPDGEEAARAKARQMAASEERRTQEQHLADLGRWWLERMLDAADPLEEKLTLFWHGHFATSAQKVRDGFYMWRQNQTLRENARGNFGAMVKAMSRDQAMIHWLDLQQSRPQHANENFARELMELFTLGEGNYTEKDVTEAARAFTGYRTDPRDQSFHFQARQHDGTAKIFLGRTGNFDGDGIIDIVLEQPACARFIARKLWTFFVSDDPAPALTDALAARLRGNRYELRPTLRTIFTSAEFYAPGVIRTQIKSPVQWVVQTARELGGGLPPTPQVLGALRTMGQVPFMPPSVKGWDGGKAWISTSTLLFRYNFAQAMLSGAGGAGGGGNLRAIMKNGGGKAGKGDALLAAAMSPPDLDENTGGSAFGAGVNGLAVVPLPVYATVPPAATAVPVQGQVDFHKVAPEGLRRDPDALLRSLALRLFQSPASPRDAEAFGKYLQAAPGGRVTDQRIYGLLHLMMSTPAFQLC